ncbi:hypothetical protein PQX77_012536 [Marasmius sp. AFHP31]|nr:hypothetical protein PQX77_012536 [Marasmius sp. AFHP31]
MPSFFASEPVLDGRSGDDEKLLLVQKQHAPQSLLESYTTERIPIISNMLNFTTDLMRRAFSQSGTTLGLMKDNKAFDMRQPGINYRASPIILDEYYKGAPQESVDPYRDGHNLKARTLYTFARQHLTV